MHKLACPKCHEPLVLKEKTYCCSHNHCYDLSKTQYLNVLLNPDKSTNNPGDSKESLIARKEFLNQSYYDVILNEVIQCIERYSESEQILDLGCGEGYYTAKMKEHFLNKEVYGLDISKIAINMATKYRKDVYWLVGNTKNLPILNESIDVITALFTVINQKEIERVLRNNGYIIHITANNQHLIEFKQLIYDEVKVKSDEYIRLDLPVVESYDFKKTIHLKNREDTIHLLSMTPHYYHIKKEKRNILDTLNEFDVTIDIRITVYQKHEISNT